MYKIFHGYGGQSDGFVRAKDPYERTLDFSKVKVLSFTVDLSKHHVSRLKYVLSFLQHLKDDKGNLVFEGNITLCI
jgi:hypothetical protein